jgi:hypothetical protein
MSEQRKVLFCFFFSLLLTTALLHWTAVKWVATALMVVGAVAVNTILTLIGGSLLGHCVAFYKERQRPQAEATTERPEWMPAVEAWPPVPPGEPDEDDEDEEEEAMRALVKTVRSHNGGFH